MEKNEIISRIFNWMAIGLFITFITGSFVATNEKLLISLYSSSGYYLICLIEIFLVIFLSARVHKMEYKNAAMMFILYSFVSGITFSLIFISYSLSSIMYIFALTSILFLIMSLIGKNTKIDLSKFSTYFFMILLGSIIIMIANIFLQNMFLDLLLSIVLLIVFVGITAYDVQRINKSVDLINAVPSMSIAFALEIYLDFINMFINLLRLFGNSRK